MYSTIYGRTWQNSNSNGICTKTILVAPVRSSFNYQYQLVITSKRDHHTIWVLEHRDAILLLTLGITFSPSEQVINAARPARDRLRLQRYAVLMPGLQDINWIGGRIVLVQWSPRNVRSRSMDLDEIISVGLTGPRE